MAIPVTNVGAFTQPVPLVATPPSTASAGLFQTTLANASAQQTQAAQPTNSSNATTSGQATTNATNTNAAQAPNLPPLPAPTLLTVLQDTGQLASVYQQDFPTATSPTSTSSASAATNSTSASPLGAATTASGNGAVNSGGNIPTSLGLQIAGFFQQNLASQPIVASGTVSPQTTTGSSTVSAGVAEQVLLQIASNAGTGTKTEVGTANVQVARLQIAATAPSSTPTQANAATPEPPSTTAVPLPPQDATASNNPGAVAVANAQNQSTPLQVPILVGLNNAAEKNTAVTVPSPESVPAAVAAAALPSAQTGERPVMAGDRLAMIAQEGANLQSVRPQSPSSFQSVLSQSVQGTNTSPVSAGTASAVDPSNSAKVSGALVGSILSPQAEPTSAPATPTQMAKPSETLAGATTRIGATSAPLTASSIQANASVASSAPNPSARTTPSAVPSVAPGPFSALKPVSVQPTATSATPEGADSRVPPQASSSGTTKGQESSSGTSNIQASSTGTNNIQAASTGTSNIQAASTGASNPSGTANAIASAQATPAQTSTGVSLQAPPLGPSHGEPAGIQVGTTPSERLSSANAAIVAKDNSSTATLATNGFSPSASTSAPSPTTATQTTSSSTLAAQLSEGVIEHAQASSQAGSTEFRMRLTPAELGTVNIQIVSTGDEVRGHVTVASDGVRQMIESQLPELRQRLEAAGVNVQSFSVATDASSSGGRNAWQNYTGSQQNQTLTSTTTTTNAAATRFRSNPTQKSGSVDVVV